MDKANFILDEIRNALDFVKSEKWKKPDLKNELVSRFPQRLFTIAGLISKYLLNPMMIELKEWKSTIEAVAKTKLQGILQEKEIKVVTEELYKFLIYDNDSSRDDPLVDMVLSLLPKRQEPDNLKFAEAPLC